MILSIFKNDKILNKPLLRKVYIGINIISILIILSYTILFIKRTLLLPFGNGDEGYFISDIEYFIQNGYEKSIIKNISIPHTLLVYSFNLIIDNIPVSLRITNILISVIICFYLFLYFNKYQKNSRFNFLILILFFISTVGYLFFGTNDALFFLGLILFFIEGYKLFNGNACNLWIMIFGLTLALTTRALFILYLPAILFLITLLKFRNISNVILGYLFIIPISILLFLNIPSLLNGNGLSFDDKKSPTKVSWPQRQYLAQLWVNEGKLPHGQHPSWEETKLYIEKNGENSLPKSLSESIFFNFKLTINEFFKDLGSIFYFGFRQVGLVILFPLLFFIKEKKNYNLTFWMIPITTYLTFSIFAFVIISYVEMRWLCPPIILLIVFFVSNTKEFSLMRSVNLVLLDVMAIYGISKYFL